MKKLILSTLTATALLTSNLAYAEGGETDEPFFTEILEQVSPAKTDDSNSGKFVSSTSSSHDTNEEDSLTYIIER